MMTPFFSTSMPSFPHPGCIDAGRDAIVEAAVVFEVAQRIDVAGDVPVITEMNRVAHQIGSHLQRERLRRVVGQTRLRDRVVRQRDRHALFGEAGRLPDFRRRYEIDGAELIVASPAPPIGKFGEHLFELFQVSG